MRQPSSVPSRKDVWVRNSLAEVELMADKITLRFSLRTPQGFSTTAQGKGGLPTVTLGTLYGKGTALECLALVKIQPKRCRRPTGFATALQTGARAAWSAAASEARRRFG